MIRRTWGYGLVSIACAILLAGCASQSGVNKTAAAAANANLGADFLRKNEIGRAQTYFRKALGYNSDNFSANWGMAVINDRFGNTDTARVFYEKTLRLQARPEIENSYGAFLCRQGDTDQALSYLQRAGRAPAYRGRANALANAGLCVYRMGRSAAAAGYFRRALAIDPNQMTALTRLAAIEYKHGRYLDARAFIQRAAAATELGADQLALGARIEQALGDTAAAADYRQRSRRAPASPGSSNQASP